jgi:nucleoside-diphosphate-sugar epimerase
VACNVFVTGGTGYVGRPLIQALLARGHAVTALARAASASALPAGVTTIIGDALDASGWTARVTPADTFVHLIGTSQIRGRSARS